VLHHGADTPTTLLTWSRNWSRKRNTRAQGTRDGDHANMVPTSTKPPNNAGISDRMRALEAATALREHDPGRAIALLDDVERLSPTSPTTACRWG
jgi:hypothetical protein